MTRKKQYKGKPALKPCDGTANDYWRHWFRGETPCDASKVAAALAKRKYVRSRTRRDKINPGPGKATKVVLGPGLYHGTVPGKPGDEQRVRAEAWDKDQSRVVKRVRIED